MLAKRVQWNKYSIVTYFDSECDFRILSDKRMSVFLIGYVKDTDTIIVREFIWW
jgi:hypothetical protein